MSFPNPLRSTLHSPPSSPVALETVVATLVHLIRPSLHQTHPYVAIWKLPSPHALPLFFALSRLNFIPVCLNSRWTPKEALLALNTIPCTTIFTTPQTTLPTQQLTPFYLVHTNNSFSLTVPLTVPPPSSSIISPSPPPPIPPRHTAAIFFTSGTTATAKPVPLTYTNLLIQSETKVALLKLPSSTRYLHLSPLYHVAGFSSSLATILVGGTHVFAHPLKSRPFSHSPYLNNLINKSAITYISAVPAVLRLLLDATTAQYPTVSTLLYGGSPMSTPLLSDVHRTYPNASIIGAYGMTETASSITFLHHNRYRLGSELHSSAGIAPPHIQLKIHPLQPDAEHPVGEVLTCGKHVFAGYLNADNSHNFFKTWFRTGDVGYVRDGHLFLLGRRADIIKSGGENVFAGEVETILSTHPNVKEAAVVGVPHRVLGEAVVAAVVLVNGVEVTDALNKLQVFCSNALASFKRPKWILTADHLPRNTTGKIVKERVRQMVQRSIPIPSKL